MNQGKADRYDGDLDDYRALIIAANKTAPSGQKSPGLNERERARKSSADARASINPLKKAAIAAETKVDKLNHTLTRLDAALAEPGLYEKDVKRATKLQKERAALIAAIAVCGRGMAQRP